MPANTDRQRWETALAEHFAREYAAHPLPTVEQLSDPEKYQGDFTGHPMVAWLKRHGPLLIQEREFLAESLGVERGANIIILSNRPGLLAASQILQHRPPSIFYLTPASFESFLAGHPDETFRWHVVYACYFSDELPREVLSLAKKKYKLRKPEQYWIHYEVSTLAPLFERGCIHLWKWNGEKPALLEEAFYTWVS